MAKRSEQEWLNLLNEFQNSDLSMAKFCKQKHICHKRFKRHLTQHQSSPATQPFIKIQQEPVPSTTAPDFITLRIKGIEISCPVSTPLHWIADLCKALS